MSLRGSEEGGVGSPIDPQKGPWCTPESTYFFKRVIQIVSPRVHNPPSCGNSLLVVQVSRKPQNIPPLSSEQIVSTSISERQWMALARSDCDTSSFPNLQSSRRGMQTSWTVFSASKYAAKTNLTYIEKT